MIRCLEPSSSETMATTTSGDRANGGALSTINSGNVEPNTDNSNTATTPTPSKGSTLIAVGEFVSEVFELINDFAFADLVDGAKNDDLGPLAVAVEENRSFLGFIGAIRPTPGLMVKATRSKRRKSSSSPTTRLTDEYDDDRQSNHRRTKVESKTSKKKEKKEKKNKNGKKEERSKDKRRKDIAVSSSTANKRLSSGRSKLNKQSLQYYEDVDDVAYAATVEEEYEDRATEDYTLATKEIETRDVDAREEVQETRDAADAAKENTRREENQFIIQNPYRRSAASSNGFLLTKKLKRTPYGGGSLGINLHVQKIKLKPPAPLITVTPRGTKPASSAADDGFYEAAESRDEEYIASDVITYCSKDTNEGGITADSTTSTSSTGLGDTTTTTNTDDDSDEATPRTVPDLEDDFLNDPYLYSTDDAELRNLDTDEKLERREPSEITNTTSDEGNDGHTTGMVDEVDSVKTIDALERLVANRMAQNSRSVRHRPGDDSERDGVEKARDTRISSPGYVSASDASVTPSIQQFHSLNPTRPAVIAKYNKQWPPLQFPEGRYESFNAEIKTRHIQSKGHLEATVPKSSRVRENRKKLARHWAMRLKQQARAQEERMQNAVRTQHDDFLDLRGGYY